MMGKIRWTVLLLTFAGMLMTARPVLAQGEKPMKAFMDKRFGMFIHFGPITLRGTEIGWSRNNHVAQSPHHL